MKLLILFLMVLVTSPILADKGQQKPSDIVEQKQNPPVEVVEKRVCGWTDSNFTHVEEGSNFNYGVSSFGSGVWGPGYNSGPRQKTIYGSQFSCSPKDFKQVTSKGE